MPTRCKGMVSPFALGRLLQGCKVCTFLTLKTLVVTVVITAGGRGAVCVFGVMEGLGMSFFLRSKVWGCVVEETFGFEQLLLA